MKVGDVVMLNSGGFAMTVSAVTDDGVECVWHDTTVNGPAALVREIIPTACLSLVPTDQDIIDDVFGADELEGVTRN